MESIKLPDTIDTKLAISLCQHFGFTYLVKRIQNNPEQYVSWVFDGASLVPDELFAKVFHIPNLVETALKHDLKYAYGESGNKQEKRQADLAFKQNLLDGGASPEVAKLMFKAVDIGGKGWLRTSFSWAYAHK